MTKYKQPYTRRFQHPGGFLDSTDYIEITPKGKCYMVAKDGTRKQWKGWTIYKCLTYVATGVWIELPRED
jgi:hypothetical protein